MALVWSQDIIYYDRSTSLYFYSYRYAYRDENDIMICTPCNIEREELYMGGGLWVYKCPKCDSEIEWEAVKIKGEV